MYLLLRTYTSLAIKCNDSILRVFWRDKPLALVARRMTHHEMTFLPIPAESSHPNLLKVGGAFFCPSCMYHHSASGIGRYYLITGIPLPFNLLSVLIGSCERLFSTVCRFVMPSSPLLESAGFTIYIPFTVQQTMDGKQEEALRDEEICLPSLLKGRKALIYFRFRTSVFFYLTLCYSPYFTRVNDFV